MNVLLTGASGFLGRQLQNELKQKYSIVSLSRSIESDITCDLSISIPELSEFDIVVHAAGKAHSTPKSEKEKSIFHQVNAVGTSNLLKGLVANPPKVFVLISTVAVYGLGTGELIAEESPLLGGSAYADSKIEAENIVQDWCVNHNVKSVILRLPLITGSNPPGNLGAMINAIKKGYYFRIGSARAKRSMVAAIDVGRLLSQNHLKEGIFNLTDEVHSSIAQTEDHLGNILNKKIKNIPEILVKVTAKIGDFIPGFPINTNRLKKLTSTLTFSDKKARKELGWISINALEELKID